MPLIWRQLTRKLPEYKMTPGGEVRIAIIKKSKNNKCWRGYGEKRTLLYCWWERKWMQPIWKAVWRFLKKIKTGLSFDPAIPLVGIYSEKIIIQEDTGTLMFIAALFAIAKM